MSDFTPTHTWHFCGEDVPVIVVREHEDGSGYVSVIDVHETPYAAKRDELTARLTDQDRYDIAVEKMHDRAADFDS